MKREKEKEEKELGLVLSVTDMTPSGKRPHDAYDLPGQHSPAELRGSLVGRELDWHPQSPGFHPGTTQTRCAGARTPVVTAVRK